MNMVEYQRAWYIANRERILARGRVHYVAKRSEILQYQKEYLLRDGKRARRRERWKVWYEARRQQRIQYTREWRAKNPDKHKAICTIQKITRRGRERGAKGAFTYESWMQKVAYYGWRCVYCKKELSHATLTIDHVKALAGGGSNWLANLVPACKSCNCSKQTKPRTSIT